MGSAGVPPAVLGASRPQCAAPDGGQRIYFSSREVDPDEITHDDGTAKDGTHRDSRGDCCRLWTLSAGRASQLNFRHSRQSVPTHADADLEAAYGGKVTDPHGFDGDSSVCTVNIGGLAIKLQSAPPGAVECRPPSSRLSWELA